MNWIKSLGMYLLVCGSSVTASEGGGSNYLPGFYGDFMMGVMPEQGAYFNNFFAAYQDPSGEVGTLLEMPSFVYATGKKILGGNYIFGIYPAVGATKDHSNGNSLDRVGLGDFYLLPFALNWQWGNLSALFYEGVVAPTGYYQKGALNAGRNNWTFDHVLSLTKPLPADNELSVTFGYMNNLQNPATRYESGDEFHFDYMLGHYFQPDFGLGVAGSHYRQTTADHAPAELLVKTYSEASTIGPVLMYTPKVSGREITMSLKWLHEFNVQGRDAVDYLVWRLFMSFN